MIKKSKIIGEIFVVLIVLGIGFGGKLYMDKRAEETLNEQILKTEKALALHLVQEYEEIETISFDSVSFFEVPGSWSFSVYFNDDRENYLSLSFYNLEKPTEDMTEVYNEKNKFIKKKIDKNRTLNDVKIDYKGLENDNGSGI